VRSLVLYSLVFSLLTALDPAWSAAQQGGITRKHHPWGRFEPGAWKLVRVETETFDENGTMSSATETRTILEDVDEDGVTLLIEVSVKVGGKRFDAQPQRVKQGFHGELANHDVKVTDLGAGRVTVQGRNLPCKIQQLEYTGPGGKTTSKIYYSDSVEPFILKRETIKTDPQSKTPLSETTVDVVAMDVPRKVLTRIRNTVHVKAVHTNANGTTTRLAVTSGDVPGGVICHTSKEVDNSGRLIRRSSLELIDHGLDVDRDRTGLFQRWRPGRLRPPRRLLPLRPKPSADDEG